MQENSISKKQKIIKAKEITSNMYYEYKILGNMPKYPYRYLQIAEIIVKSMERGEE